MTLCPRMILPLVAGLLLTGPGLAQETPPEFEGLGEAYDQTLDLVGDLETYGVSDIVRLVRRNLDTVEAMSALIADAENIDEVIGDIAGQMERLSDSFGEIAAKAPEIVAFRRQRLSDLEGLAEQVDIDIEDLQREMADTDLSLEALADRLAVSADADEQRRLEVRQRALTAHRRNLEAIAASWQLFARRHEQIMDQIAGQDENLDELFDVFELNALVYGSAARAMRAAADIEVITGEMRTLTDNLAELNGLMGEIIDSWTTINSIIEDTQDRQFMPGM